MCLSALKPRSEKPLARVTVFPLRLLFSPVQLTGLLNWHYPYYTTEKGR